MRIGLGYSMGCKIKTGAFPWAAYWAGQSEVLFFGEVSKITGGLLYNQVPGAFDYLTVTGAAGSYTFQCPNTAPYIAADTDYIWFKTDTTQRTTTTAELVGYDLPRTPVKYDDDAPYSIRWIMILKAVETLSADSINKLHQSFMLPLFWSGVENVYGVIKGNRALVQQLWTPELVFDARTIELIANTAAEGEVMEEARQQKLNTAIVALKAEGLFDTHFDCFWVCHGKGAWTTKMNWIKDLHNLEEVANGGALTFTNDLGYQTDGKAYIRTHYNPSADGVRLALNDAVCGLLLGGAVAHDEARGYLGATSIPPATIANAYINIYNPTTTGGRHRINQNANDNTAYMIEVGWFAISRTASTAYNLYENDNDYARTLVSSEVPNAEMTLLCLSLDWETPSTFAHSSTILKIAFAGKSLTRAQFNIIRTIMNEYVS